MVIPTTSDDSNSNLVLIISEKKQRGSFVKNNPVLLLQKKQMLIHIRVTASSLNRNREDPIAYKQVIAMNSKLRMVLGMVCKSSDDIRIHRRHLLQIYSI